MSTTFNTDDKVKVGFKMFLQQLDEDSPEFRFQLYNLQNETSAGAPLLYDSHLNKRNLPFKLAVGDSTTYDNAIALQSQIPFGFQCYAQNQNQGWAKMNYASF